MILDPQPEQPTACLSPTEVSAHDDGIEGDNYGSQPLEPRLVYLSRSLGFREAQMSLSAVRVLGLGLVGFLVNGFPSLGLSAGFL